MQDDHSGVTSSRSSLPSNSSGDQLRQQQQQLHQLRLQLLQQQLQQQQRTDDNLASPGERMGRSAKRTRAEASLGDSQPKASGNGTVDYSSAVLPTVDSKALDASLHGQFSMSDSAGKPLSSQDAASLSQSGSTSRLLSESSHLFGGGGLRTNQIGGLAGGQEQPQALPSSFQALLAAQGTGSRQLPISSQSTNFGGGSGDNSYSNSPRWAGNDLQLAMRGNDLANEFMRLQALGQLHRSLGTSSASGPGNAPSADSQNGRPIGQGNLGASTGGGITGLSSFFDLNNPNTVPGQGRLGAPSELGGFASFFDRNNNPFARGAAFNQLLMRTQLAEHIPQHPNPLLGQPGISRLTQQPQSGNQNFTTSFANQQSVNSADLLFARHGHLGGSTIPPQQRAGGRPGVDTPNFANRGPDGFPLDIPFIMALPEDHLKLSAHQVLLRHQIEAFRASDEDLSTHTRGRNKPITLGQIGIRCRHCAYLQVGRRQKGSTYFPAAVLGLYQAAQNMSTTHMQCGLCSEMPGEIKQQFAHLISTKVASSGAGRPYWARAAKKLGLVDTEDGIRFIRDLVPVTEAATTAKLET